MAGAFSFTVKTQDLIVKFFCANHEKRIGEFMNNVAGRGLGNGQSEESFFSSESKDIEYCFNDVACEGNDIRHEAVFFENTDYPLIAKGNRKTLQSISFFIAGKKQSDTDRSGTIVSDKGELYGSFNFRNQVGVTDFCFRYQLQGEEKVREVGFSTEVLSYKLDYRNDFKAIIADVEREYAMLSYSFLKDTYLQFKLKNGESTELVWWQIFKSCYNEIVHSAKVIMDRPKRRLRTNVSYERAERLRTLPRELQAEYRMHKEDLSYLYRTEELVLSHDTVENRFLKYALCEMQRKFTTIRDHIVKAIRLDDPEKLGFDIEAMGNELQRLTHHPFFRGIGTFKGFSQDSLVMKQATGYRDILTHWIALQQGFDLEEGTRKLEVKDISELYEIWCFIKVKNIVEDVLRERESDLAAKINGSAVSREFIPQLLYGGSVSFIKKDGVELASVVYNAQTEKEERHSAIKGTTTLTTEQRPDIVLRLSKEGDDMLYTYLFDAKYRINDTQIDGQDVPPEDAINQMHRYRDAIYYREKNNEKLKKEVIAGYVLFPGNVHETVLKDGTYYYQKSNRRIGIGAFPLKPERKEVDEEGEPKENPLSSEQALRRQIKEWLEDEDARTTLLQKSVPQKGLSYADAMMVEGAYFVSTVDPVVNKDKESLIEGTGTVFISGYNTLTAGVNFNKVQYLALVDENSVRGFYTVEDKKIVDVSTKLNDPGTQKLHPNYKGYNQPYRMKLTLSKYTPLEEPFPFGIASRFAGTTLNRKEFQERINSTKQ